MKLTKQELDVLAADLHRRIVANRDAYRAGQVRFYDFTRRNRALWGEAMAARADGRIVELLRADDAAVACGGAA